MNTLEVPLLFYAPYLFPFNTVDLTTRSQNMLPFLLVYSSMGPSSEEQRMGQGSAAALNAHGSTDTTTSGITYFVTSHIGQKGVSGPSPPNKYYMKELLPSFLLQEFCKHYLSSWIIQSISSISENVWNLQKTTVADDALIDYVAHVLLCIADLDEYVSLYVSVCCFLTYAVIPLIFQLNT